MTPDAYCQTRAAPTGSTGYYATLFIPREQRRILWALWSLRAKIDTLLSRCSDPSVALKTLDWWRREIAAAVAGSPSHPITRSLAPLLAASPYRPDSELDRLMLGFARRLETAVEDSSTWLECRTAPDVSVARLAAGLGGVEDPVSLTRIGRLGALSGGIELLRPDTPARSVEAPPPPSRTDALRQERSDRVSRLRFATGEALSALATGSHPPVMLAYVTRLTIQGAALDRIAKSGDHAGGQPLDITPIRKLWIAWRCQQRFGRPATAS